jgi:predicted Zn-dependent protease
MFSVLGQASGQPDYVRYVQNYYDALMTQKRKAEAKPWLDQLEKLAPDQISTATSEAIFLYRAKDYKRLFAMLETKSKQSKEYVGWAAELSENFARGLSGEGENSEAEKFLEFSKQLYADIAASEPNGKLIQAAFYRTPG